MGMYLKASPSGIDYYIQQLQVLLYNRLVVSWGDTGLASAMFDFYGRAYKLYRFDGFEPNVFTGGKEYKEVLFNDKLAALMWFGLNDSEAVDTTTQHRYKISLYGFVNLARLNPNETDRTDVEVINEVVNLINGSFGFYVQQVYHNADSVLSMYSGTKVKEGVKTFNMQPNAIFRIDMTQLSRTDLNQTVCTPQSAYPIYFNTMSCYIRVIFKDSPDSSFTQTLCNGNKIALQYQAGTNTVTVPHLIGRYVQITQILDLNNTILSYDPLTGTFTYPEGIFYENSELIIFYNEST
jgi:hypothetical protein